MFFGNRNRRLMLLMVILIGAFVWLQGCGQAFKAEEENRVTSPDPKQQEQLKELNRTADELYQKAAAGDFMKARDSLIRLGDQVASMSFAGIASVEGVDALTDAVTDAKRVFNAVKLNPDQAIKSAAKLKLAVDALTHPNQPMWLQYYKVLTEDTKEFEKAVAAGNNKDALVRLASIKDHYDTIRTAVWISRAPEIGEKMDSLLVFFTKYSEGGNFQGEVLLSGIEQWKQALDQLFGKAEDRTAYVPYLQPDKPILWTLTVGSVIVMVLSFAAWRMFQSEQSLIKSPRPRHLDGE